MGVFKGQLQAQTAFGGTDGCDAPHSRTQDRGLPYSMPGLRCCWR